MRETMALLLTLVTVAAVSMVNQQQRICEASVFESPVDGGPLIAEPALLSKALLRMHH